MQQLVTFCPFSAAPPVKFLLHKEDTDWIKYCSDVDAGVKPGLQEHMIQGLPSDFSVLYLL